MNTKKEKAMKAIEDAVFRIKFMPDLDGYMLYENGQAINILFEGPERAAEWIKEQGR